eukprot:4559850-Alexandrium_andersonii.AAC.1
MDSDKDLNCVGILVVRPHEHPPVVPAVEGRQVPGRVALLTGGVLRCPRGHCAAEGRLRLPQ